MRAWTCILLFAVVAMIMGCAGTSLQGFKEPTSDETMLIVGSVILEDNYYTEETAVYKKNIEVAVLGKSEAGEQLAFWTTTDENGYFSIADVPKGEYALKAIRVLIGQGSFVTIENRLRVSSDAYWLSTKQTVIFRGEYFPFEPKDRITSLQHNHFMVDRMSQSTQRVNHSAKNRLENLKLVSGETISAGQVEEYFIEKYPQSAWVPFLKKAADIVRFQR
jgi:hypothetical protein